MTEAGLSDRGDVNADQASGKKSVRWRLGQDKVVSPLVDPIRRRLRLLHNAVTKRVGDSIYSKD